MRYLSIIQTHICLILLLSLFSTVQAEDREILNMSLEELMEVEAFSASKKMEKVNDVPAAVFVISKEDIRRSTANSIPELLRIVPGLSVARISASSWSISSRGFNGRFSNKLLVLIDGRTVYNPVFSGVFWNIQDTMLEDVERIEVIRGPGGALWGANAVNGIINIITKHSKDTNGFLASAGGGTEERGFGSIRYGHKFSDGDVRFYSKYYNRDDSHDPISGDSRDQTDAAQGGFRSDFELSDKDTLQFQGDIFSTDEDAMIDTPDITAPPTFSTSIPSSGDHRGGNVLARWERNFSETSSFSLQAYYNREDRKDANANFEVDTYDIELQHRTLLADSHDFTWGAGFR